MKRELTQTHLFVNDCIVRVMGWRNSIEMLVNDRKEIVSLSQTAI